MMLPEQEDHYLKLALDNANMTCSEAPAEILEACAADAEPTKFLEEFFATGYSQWILEKYGRRLPQERINNAIIVLWHRACRLHTNRLLNLPESDGDQPFFSDQDLYDSA